MSGPADMSDEVRKLRDEVGELKTTTRVTKHDVANLQMGMNGLTQRVEKIVDQLSRELKETRESLSNEMRSELKLVSSEIAGINKVQARGAGFYAGVMAVITVGGGILLGIAKLLFGGAQHS
jgi:predicted  nucleic acid-binding Zn-ribbon protein